MRVRTFGLRSVEREGEGVKGGVCLLTERKG
jgi:hypothetical protein